MSRLFATGPLGDIHQSRLDHPVHRCDRETDMRRNVLKLVPSKTVHFDGDPGFCRHFSKHRSDLADVVAQQRALFRRGLGPRHRPIGRLVEWISAFELFAP